MEGSYSLIAARDNAMDDEIRLNYLSVPLSFFYMPNNQVQLFIGPQVNILLHQNGPHYITKQGKESFEHIDYGIQASFEIGFAYNVSVAFRYYQGLNYNSKNELDNFAETLNRISAIQLCLNYFLCQRKPGNEIH
ncbi:MAG TPA: outer membrane beta-barrel protein [Cyclobacteriaceae bacterium]